VFSATRREKKKKKRTWGKTENKENGGKRDEKHPKRRQVD